MKWSANKRIPKKRRKLLRMARTAGIGIASLSVLFVVGGVIYIYFGEPADQTATIAEEDKQIELREFDEPPIPAEDAAVGVSTQALTSPVAPGTNASLTVKTLRDASCDIAVYSDESAETEVNDSGLATKTANEYGVVSWAWSVAPDATEGTWPIRVECSRNEQSGVLLPTFEVKQETTD